MFFLTNWIVCAYQMIVKISSGITVTDAIRMSKLMWAGKTDFICFFFDTYGIFY